MVRFEIVNAFTDRVFTGSPLAVVPDAAALSTGTMQAIAAELNVVETVFVLPPSLPGSSYRVRVFTPDGEAASAAHASVGTAATLVRLGVVPAGTVVQENGSVRHRLAADATSATLLARDPLPGASVDRAAACAAVGLTTADTAAAAPRSVGFGVGFPLLAVAGDAVARATPDLSEMRASGFATLFVFAWDPGRWTARARLFAPGFGIPEDPACGPVALALGIFLAGAGWLPGADGTYRYRIRQGAASGRAAALDCTVTLQDGRPRSGTATGHVITVACGHVDVPPGTGERTSEGGHRAASS